MFFQPRPDVQQYRKNVVAMLAVHDADKQVLYYDPTNELYWDPRKDEFYTAEETISLMRQALTKITFRFDSKFPK